MLKRGLRLTFFGYSNNVTRNLKGVSDEVLPLATAKLTSCFRLKASVVQKYISYVFLLVKDNGAPNFGLGQNSQHPHYDLTMMLQSAPMPSVTSIEGNNNNKNGDADNRQSRFAMSSILVVVDAKTCLVKPNKEGGVGNVLDSSGDGAFDIYDVGHQYGSEQQQQYWRRRGS